MHHLCVVAQWSCAQCVLLHLLSRSCITVSSSSFSIRMASHFFRLLFPFCGPLYLDFQGPECVSCGPTFLHQLPSVFQLPNIREIPPHRLGLSSSDPWRCLITHACQSPNRVWQSIHNQGCHNRFVTVFSLLSVTYVSNCNRSSLYDLQLIPSCRNIPENSKMLAGFVRPIVALPLPCACVFWKNTVWFTRLIVY